MIFAVAILSTLVVALVVGLALVARFARNGGGYRELVAACRDREREARDRARQAVTEAQGLRHELEADGVRANIGRQVVLQLPEGPLKGVLVRVYAKDYALERAEFLGTSGSRELGGAALIPRSRVAWVQLFETEAS